MYPMYYAMLQRVLKYLDKARACETLVLATILHPCFRMHIFELGFGTESIEVTKCLNLLKQRFKIYKEQHKANDQPAVPDSEVTEIERPPTAEPQSLMQRLASRMAETPAAHEDEVEVFLKADIPFKNNAINRKSTPLHWWKANSDTYPALSQMARA